MASFAVTTYPIKVSSHPDPEVERLEVGQVGDFMIVVAKGQYKTGDIVAYIPENSLVPEPLLEKMGLVGKLGGSKNNRVRPTKLRGVLSEGLVYPMPDHQAGEDVTELLGITKYEPKLPVNMEGTMWNAGTEKTMNYDIENIKKYPNVLAEGEEVYVTEKIHGSFVVLADYEGQLLVSSKGQFAKGLCLQYEDGANPDNIYVEQLRRHQDRLAQIKDRLKTDICYVFGEIVGPSVQSFDYGLKERTVYVFDIYIGQTRKGRFLNVAELKEATDGLFELAPKLYCGPFDYQTILDYTVAKDNDGKSVIDNTTTREGLVIRPLAERTDPELGRVILKSISEAYQLVSRKKNITEYQ